MITHNSSEIITTDRNIPDIILKKDIIKIAYIRYKKEEQEYNKDISDIIKKKKDIIKIYQTVA